MLRELHIANLAVIEDARIDLSEGLICFTGATGAGKSLVIGAVEILLGLRSATDMLRNGAAEARVSGLFEPRSAEILTQIAELIDAPVENDRELLLVRRIFASGRSTASLNGHAITLAMLKQIGELLVDVHGQHDHQYLLKTSNQLQTLDDFAAAETIGEKYRQTWTLLQTARQKLTNLSRDQEIRRQRLELLRFQAQEIDQAKLDAREHASLEARQVVLANLQRLRTESSQIQAAIYESEDAIVDRLKPAAADLIELASIDPQLLGVAEQVKQSLIMLEEAAFDLSRYTQKLDLDPAEIEDVVERLNTINRILKKYGHAASSFGEGVAGVIGLRESISRQLDQLVKSGHDESELSSTIGPLENTLKEAGGRLSAARKTAAVKLSRLIEKQLAELGMEKAKLTIELLPLSEPGASGLESCEFVVQTNPGQAAAPLRKIASGGEIGRILLALKSTLAAGDRVSVLVFDEIDANIGGRLGSVIGAKLRDLANRHQVLCITHLPQIAAFASQHLSVRKEQTGRSTKTSVRVLEGDARIEELADMIGGTRVTDTTRAQARELLATGELVSPIAKKIKKTLGSAIPSRPSISLTVPRLNAPKKAPARRSSES